MSLFTIPTRTDLESYVEQVELDGVVYEFDVTWNQRDGAWYLSLSDAEGKPIASGLRIVVDFPLLHYVGHPDKPPGTLMAIDTSGSGVDPGLSELGGRVQLVYHAATE
jgi:hypothetical protein